MDVDIRPEGIIPTVGAMQASYVAFMALTECHKGKDTILFIDPGISGTENPTRSHRQALSNLRYL